MSATIEIVCSCEERAVIADRKAFRKFEAHMDQHRDHVVHAEINGRPVDRKPRAGSVPVSQPKED